MTSNAPEIHRRGFMFVLSSPSGAGKTTLSRMLLDEDDNLEMSISMTTRAKRPGEVDGKDYHFIAQEEFTSMVEQGAFLECAEVFDHAYGTPEKPVLNALTNGTDVLFDIDWQGTKQLAERKREDLVSVFILPPSMKELESRLKKRAQDSQAVIDRRMSKASNEISHWFEYDYVVVNYDLQRSLQEVKSILWAERLKRDRQQGLPDFINQLLG